MSAEAVGWVFRHSPLTGSGFNVHIAIADSVNDQNHYELWARMPTIAAKARCSRGSAQRAIARLIELGLLIEIDDGRESPESGAPSRARRFQMLMPDDHPVVFQTRGGRAPRATGRESGAGGRAHSATPTSLSLKPKVEPKVEQPRVVDAASLATTPDRPEIEALCEHLAERVGAYADQPPPPVTDRWRKDMRLLVDRGPLHQRVPEPVDPVKVRNSIDVIFDQMADPEGGSGFCWAAQIRSPGALRDHWHQMRDAHRRANAATRGPTALAIERTMRRAGATGTQPSLRSLMERARNGSAVVEVGPGRERLPLEGGS